MLDTLHIENIAVVKEADLEFTPGFTVLTGETGAGKSIIIDSINLLLGARPQRELIRTGAQTGVVSAVFADLPGEFLSAMTDAGMRTEEDGSLFLQRTVSADGRASTRINGRPVSVSVQREFISRLISIHGQHDNQMFLKPETHIGYLDAYAGLEEARCAYQEAYRVFAEIRGKIRSLQRGEQEKARMAELLKYQLADIDAGHLKPKEEEQLTEKRIKIRSMEKITKQVKTVYRALYRSEKGYAASEQIDRAAAALEQIADVIPEAADYVEKLNGFRYELEDIAETVRGYAEETEGDPTILLDRIETRLETIARLKKKYGATVEEVLAYRQKAEEELDDITLSDEKTEALHGKEAEQRAVLDRLAAVLTERRKSAGKELSARIMEELKFLDMDKVRFAVDVRPYRPSGEDAGTEAGYTPNGRDTVEFLISTNPGEPLRPLDKIASGGELARIMLAAKCVTAKTEQIHTMIFDEVDTGVSGKTSRKIGMKLRELGQSGCQVLCVTHSAQIASLADQHFFISKKEVDGRMETSVTKLDRQGRIDELSRIIGGLEITDVVRATAEELLSPGIPEDG